MSNVIWGILFKSKHSGEPYEWDCYGDSIKVGFDDLNKAFKRIESLNTTWADSYVSELSFGDKYTTNKNPHVAHIYGEKK